VERAELDAIVRSIIDAHPTAILARHLGARLRSGSGTPEGVVDAPMGVIWADVDSGAVYRKTTAAGTLTGWTAM
jgi:hypothetical protein